ncbi:MAG: hypothetical protein KJ970_00440 [Candidatus Eisenbacteria bacterium]|uniref:Uncharacterized protein n=1 Tax=Eiseniibacteriota bacterium TaxID=2212470 RepID=A0A948RUU6_UNCEI|nr:hypothetical protein [Candidatus Eisenbacteria bacterium]MBU1949152.1 hypothetical protein [Candidatus Eisenbacteria bacterium]MBU2689367.1 hypothetical protein [Candidatus Eisenbacteria bacterium]
MFTHPFRFWIRAILGRGFFYRTGFFLFLLFFWGCGQDSKNPAVPGSPAGETRVILTGQSDLSGTARLAKDSGDLLMEAELRDLSGAPLSGYPVTLLMSGDVVLIAFQTPETGCSCGTLLLKTTPGSKQESASDPIHAGTFILNRDDPRGTRLYDAALDPHPTQASASVTGAQLIEDPAQLMEILQQMPGLRDEGSYTLSDLAQDRISWNEEVVYVMPPAASFPDSGGPILFVRASFGDLLPGMPSEFVVRLYKTAAGRNLCIPEGLEILLDWESPVAGETFAGPEESTLDLAGRLSLPQSLLNDPELKIEWTLDGAAVPGSGDLKMALAGALDPLHFSVPVDLAPGSHRLDLAVILPPRLRGLMTPVSGEAIHVRRTILYEPDRSASSAPTLTQFSHPQTAPAPEASFYLSFYFQDPDADVTTAHESIRWSLNGLEGSWAGSGRVTETAELEGFTALEGQIHFPLSFYGAIPGDWIEWTFWVEDAQGHASHPLHARVEIISRGSSLAAIPASLQQLIPQQRIPQRQDGGYPPVRGLTCDATGL